MTVLVLGSTGKIGQYLVKQLVEKGAKVKVLVRDVAKAQTLLPAQAEFIKGDYTNFSEFEASLAGVERLFLLTNSPLDEGALALKAKGKGVKQIVKLSCVFANAAYESGTIFYRHGVAEQQVLAAGLDDVVILRPHDFFQNLLGSAGSIKGQNVFYGNHGNAGVGSICASDIARSAAAILTDNIGKHNNRTYTLTGPSAPTKVELAVVISGVLGKTVSYADVGDVGLYKTFLGFHLPEDVAFYLANLGVTYRLLLTGNPWITGSVEMITGSPPKSWEQFLTENKTAFQ